MNIFKLPTLKTVAEKAGTTPGTVSRILNGKGKEIRISDEMITKVKAIADELRYKPHNQAQNLKLGISNVIGVSIPMQSQSELIFRLFSGISEAAMNHGKSLLFFAPSSADENIQVLKKCIEARVDGIITMQLHDKKHMEFLNSLLHAGIKIVTVLGRGKKCRCRNINVNNIIGAEMAVEYLIGKGHKKIAHIGNISKASVGWERYQGYKRALQKHGLFNPILCRDIAGSPQEAYAATKDLIREKLSPSAVFFWNDISAVNGQRAILEINPDIEIMGYDNRDFIKYLEHPFPTVHLPLQEIGQQAIEMVLGSNSLKEVVIKPYLKDIIQ